MTTPDIPSLVESVLQSSFPAPEEPNAVQKLYDIAITAKPLARACNEKDKEITRLRAELAEEKRKVEVAMKAIEHERRALTIVRDRQHGQIGVADLNMGIELLDEALAALTTPSDGGEL